MSRYSYEVESLKKEWDKGPHYHDHGPDGPYLAWWKPGCEIHFENDQQKAIWMMLLGQLSDGYWENSNINWMFWYSLTPIVDGTLGWKVDHNNIPSGEWPVDISCLEEHLYDIFQPAVENYFDLESYSNDQFYEDYKKVEISMGKSLRKIGYLE